jgi:ribosomal protein S14
MAQGTVQREQIYVYDTCQSCGEQNSLVYAAGEQLLCADDYRKYAAANPLKPQCDRCGSESNVLRDPSHRRNEYFCMQCHAETGFAPSNSVVYRTLMELLKKDQKLE